MFRLTSFRALFVFSTQLYRLLHCPSHISPFSPPFESAWGILFSSLLGISLSSSFDHLSPLSHSLVGSSLSLLPFLSRLSLLFLSPSLYYLSFESAWAYCSARSWEFFSLSALSLSLLSSFCIILYSSLPLLPLPFLLYSFLPFLCFPLSLRSPSLWHTAQLAPYFLLLSPSFLPFGSAWAYCPVRP